MPNTAFDAVQGEDRALIEFKLEQAFQGEMLIQASLVYVKELRSPLVPWLQSLFEPSFPLAPAS